MNGELIIDDLPDEESSIGTLFGFSMRRKDGKNKKFCWIGIHKVTNPDHEHYGQFTFLAWWLRNHEIFYSYEKTALKVARTRLAKMKEEYQSGKRNWWTGQIKKEAEHEP